MNEPLTYTQSARRLTGRIVKLSMGLYGAAYLVLTLSGSHAYGGPELAWNPRWCTRVTTMVSRLERRELTRLGLFFLPLLRADQAVWHRTRDWIVDCL